MILNSAMDRSIHGVIMSQMTTTVIDMANQMLSSRSKFLPTVSLSVGHNAPPEETWESINCLAGKHASNKGY